MLESNNAVDESLRGAQLARLELLTEYHQSWIRLCRLPEGVEEVKSRSRDGTGMARRRVPARESVGHNILVAPACIPQ